VRNLILFSFLELSGKKKAKGKKSGSSISSPTTADIVKTQEDDAGDTEFAPPSDVESDKEDTIEAQEKKENEAGLDHGEEIKELESENTMSVDELIAKYYAGASEADLEGKKSKLELFLSNLLCLWDIVQFHCGSLDKREG
jgi:hypothetical protein